MNLQRIVARLPQHVVDGLDEAAAARDVPRAKLVREALAPYGAGREPAVPESRGAPQRAVEKSAPSLRARIVARMQASPEETFTPGQLAHAIGSENRDSVRNTLLVLASKGKIEKVSEGKYRARRVA